ncbi:MAG: TIM barrel protein [Methylacidiphilales bacterium]|nr:TIM barrel protein [Candidatus Methylacidiphilales bacterium]
MKPRLTMLNAMAGHEIEPALDRHVEWGLKDLDLKDQVYGKSIIDLNPDEAERLVGAMQRRGLSAYCFSTILFHEPLTPGEAHFRNSALAALPRTLAVARMVKPKLIRLLDPRGSGRFPDWMIGLYREAVDQISAAGFQTTIENECHDCLFGNVENIIDFFQRLDRPRTATFTWDIQNLWSNGTFPSLEVYHKLKPWMNYVHFKGGQSETPGGSLKWKSSLADASWPVQDIARQVLRDAISPVWCLNSSHGDHKPGVDYSNVTQNDMAFLRKVIAEG